MLSAGHGVVLMGKTELTGAYMAQMADEWRKANPEAFIAAFAEN